MNYIIKGLIFIISLSISSYAYAESNLTHKPIFPVKLEHELPEARKTFEEVKGLILDNYYTGEISEDALYWASIKGMLRHISPPENKNLATIWTRAKYQKILDRLKGQQVSFGFRSSYNPDDGSLTVIEIMHGSPAESVLQAHDRILEIDSTELKGLSLKELKSLFEGEEGAEVTLTINRGLEIFDLTIKRKKFKTENIIISRLADSIAIVEIRKFTTDLPQKLENELRKLKKENFSGLILDVRNNTGGLFMEALKTVEIFLGEQNILLRTFDRKKELQNYVSANPDPLEFQIVVLVNEKSASSAEILAASLQDHKKALIVGTSTYGKGVFEKTFTMKNDFRVKFITGAMYSPKGRSWQGKGIVPDFLIKQNNKTLRTLMNMDMKERLKRDTGLITAIKLIKLDRHEDQ